MKVEVPRGKYVLAVSGGVDSMALLHILASKPRLELVVAHFNHGIRDESGSDEKLVVEVVRKMGLELEIGRGHLGEQASEAAARAVRYSFLDRVRLKHDARLIITAHHQDDAIETALLNCLRGSGRLGLSAITNNKQIIRPLLHMSKAEIISYAVANRLKWTEDATNSSEKYLRNRLRLNALGSMSKSQREELISNIDKVAKINSDINNEIATLSQLIVKNNRIDRRLFSSLPNEVAAETVAYLLRQWNVKDFDRPFVLKTVIVLKTARPGTSYPLSKYSGLAIRRTVAQFNNTLH